MEAYKAEKELGTTCTSGTVASSYTPNSAQGVLQNVPVVAHDPFTAQKLQETPPNAAVAGAAKTNIVH